jgi:formylmethanofuran dehydrogenase subunit E
MNYPDFFDSVPQIKMHDPLADFLGAVNDGVIEYRYIDVVKLAGHSCPTVASAYWMTYQALQALYGNDLPERGAIRVEFREGSLTGVTGVVANVISMLTGATHDTGFKGIAGHFDRRNLLFFGADVPLEIRFMRLDTGAQVDVVANIRQVPSNPEMPVLMQRSLSGEASVEEAQRFGALWQERVRCILLDHGADPEVFIVRRVG